MDLLLPNMPSISSSTALHLPARPSLGVQPSCLLPASLSSPSSQHFGERLDSCRTRLASPSGVLSIRSHSQQHVAGRLGVQAGRRSPFSSRIASSTSHRPQRLKNRESLEIQRAAYAQVQAAKKTFSSFDDLLQSSESPVLVDFYATWCGPCQFMVPVLDDVGRALKDRIRVAKIDTEKYPNIAGRYGVQALPTLILFQDGKPIDRLEGALPAPELIKRIEGVLSSSKAKARD